MSKLPLFAVAECSLGPLLVQVMVSPTWIVVVAGENWKSEIVSPGSPAARGEWRAAGRLAGWLAEAREVGFVLVEAFVGATGRFDWDEPVRAGAGVEADVVGAGAGPGADVVGRLAAGRDADVVGALAVGDVTEWARLGLPAPTVAPGAAGAGGDPTACPDPRCSGSGVAAIARMARAGLVGRGRCI